MPAVLVEELNLIAEGHENRVSFIPVDIVLPHGVLVVVCVLAWGSTSIEPSRNVMAIRPREKGHSSLCDCIIRSESQRGQVIMITRLEVAGSTCARLAVLPTAFVVLPVTAKVISDTLSTEPRGVLITKAKIVHVVANLAAVVTQRLRASREVCVVPDGAAVITRVLCRLEEDWLGICH